jgi:hypothetical protein
VRLGITAYEVIFVFNHIIFDAESRRVLQDQLRRLSKRKDRSPGTNQKDYHHYVSFLNDLTYENVELEKYLDLDNYLRYVDRSYKKFTFTKFQRDSFEIDLSILNDRWKDFYIEIMLLCYAGLIRKFFDIEQVPIAAYTNGRNYKNENFNDLIGFFSDMTPILFSFKKNFDPVTKIENLVDYRKYIWENNLHFTNYFLKKGNPAGANLIPPFHFNAVMDFYDYLKTGMHDEMHKTFRSRELSGTVFELLMSRDIHSDSIYIMFSQTSPFENRELTEHFKKDYVEAADYFNSRSTN